MIVAELLMGRKWGTLTLFAPNSRGLIDVYTLSHIIHGMIFYGLYTGLFGFDLSAAFVLAVTTECCWEVFKNTPWVIARYRKTVAVDYAGDTVLNSISDVLSMGCGLAYAVVFGWQAATICGIGFELWALWSSRDNLTLNILMLIYPFEAIKRWQKGGE